MRRCLPIESPSDESSSSESDYCGSNADDGMELDTDMIDVDADKDEKVDRVRAN